MAFEMAQQIHSQGRSVGLVALLDTDFEGRLDCLTRSESLARRLRLTQQRLGVHVQAIRELHWSDFGTYFREKANILKTRLASRFRQTVRNHDVVFRRVASPVSPAGWFSSSMGIISCAVRFAGDSAPGRGFCHQSTVLLLVFAFDPMDSASFPV